MAICDEVPEHATSRPLCHLQACIRAYQSKALFHRPLRLGQLPVLVGHFRVHHLEGWQPGPEVMKQGRGWSHV